MKTLVSFGKEILSSLSQPILRLLENLGRLVQMSTEL